MKKYSYTIELNNEQACSILEATKGFYLKENFRFSNSEKEMIVRFRNRLIAELENNTGEKIEDNFDHIDFININIFSKDVFSIGVRRAEAFLMAKLLHDICRRQKFIFLGSTIVLHAGMGVRTVPIQIFTEELRDFSHTLRRFLNADKWCWNNKKEFFYKEGKHGTIVHGYRTHGARYEGVYQ